MSEDRFQMISLGLITPSATNPRRTFDKAAIADLVESIRVHGVVQPVLLRPYDPDKGDPVGKALGIGKRGQARSKGQEVALYELVAGERRWRAAKEAGLGEIPALVRALDDKAAIEIQVIENLQRSDLHPLEEAQGYEKLMQSHGYTAEALAAKIGKSKGYVYARMKLTALGDKARKAFADGRINASVALLIARIPDPKIQEELLEDISGDEYEGPTPEKAVREIIHRKYLLRLGGAPFDPKDPDLVPGAGSCADCPKPSPCAAAWRRIRQTAVTASING